MEDQQHHTTTSLKRGVKWHIFSLQIWLKFEACIGRRYDWWDLKPSFRFWYGVCFWLYVCLFVCLLGFIVLKQTPFGQYSCGLHILSVWLALYHIGKIRENCTVKPELLFLPEEVREQKTDKYNKGPKALLAWPLNNRLAWWQLGK